MEKNKQQTVLRFFLMGLIDLEIGKGISTDKVIELHYLFEKAKEMDKVQAFEIFKAGQDSMEQGGKGFDQYYNETYGGGNK
jgi:hypothetical protein